MKKYQKFLSENFHFLVVTFSVHLNRHVFVHMNIGYCNCVFASCFCLLLISSHFAASGRLCFVVMDFLAGWLHLYSGLPLSQTTRYCNFQFAITAV